jgi:ribosomal protein S18 acetylase RimI-like enzyme
MVTREATLVDAVELQTIMAKAAQGADDGLVVSLFNTPDFFSRARLYEDATVFVVEEDGQIAGSAACTIREVMVGGRLRRVAYEFQYFTAVTHRRRGVAGRLRERIEQHLAGEDVAFTTAIVADTNQASIGLFEGHGFQRHRDLTLRFLHSLQHNDVSPDPGIRRARPDDLEAIARLVTETWAGHDFAAPVSARELARNVERMPAHGLDRLLVRESEGEIVASAGAWGWSSVQRIDVHTVAPHLQHLFPTFRAGQSLRQWGLTPVGFRRPQDLASLLCYVVNRAHSQRMDQVGVMHEPGDALSAVLDGFSTSAVGFGLYVKSLREATAPAARPAFVDVIDI